MGVYALTLTSLYFAYDGLMSFTGDTRATSSIPGSGRPPGGGNDTCSSILAWEIPRAEESGRGVAELELTVQLSTHPLIFYFLIAGL